MFSDIMFRIKFDILKSFIEYKHDEDSWCYKEVLEIIKNIEIIDSKAMERYDPTNIDAYKLLAINLIKKKLICPSLHQDTYDFCCDKCIEYSYSLKTLIEMIKINNDKIINNDFWSNALNIIKEGKNYKNKDIEKQIKLKLQASLGGEIEVKTRNGYIDLLTDTEIIEIKIGKNWKAAIGQILVYALDYPKHIKRLHLFKIKNDENINNICKLHNIKVSYEE